jgi:hypothetical protein
MLWSSGGLAADEEYDAAADKIEEEHNKKIALVALSGRLAENLYNYLTIKF